MPGSALPAPGRTLAAVREAIIKAAVRQVPARLPPRERVARVKEVAMQLWAERYPGTPFPTT